MYCTLQEAYQVPSFAEKRRKPAGCKKAPGGVQDAGFYDPAQDRREVAAYQRSGGPLKEGFEGTLGPEPTYKNRQNDYKYYCDNYRICDSESRPGVVEGFEDMPAPKAVNRPQEQCGPLQPPPYEFPISDAAKKQYKSAFDVALNQSVPSNPIPSPAKMRTINMDHVTGYYDEDFEAYLQTKDMKSASIAMPQKEPFSSSSYEPDASPVAEAIRSFDGQMTPAKESSKPPSQQPSQPSQPKVVEKNVVERATPPVDRMSQWMDILLFVFAGLLVIFLCDQLIRLGMLMGMKQTIESLKPILERIESKL